MDDIVGQTALLDVAQSMLNDTGGDHRKVLGELETALREWQAPLIKEKIGGGCYPKLATEVLTHTKTES